jgi:hypothetical protein
MNANLLRCLMELVPRGCPGEKGGGKSSYAMHFRLTPFCNDAFYRRERSRAFFGLFGIHGGRQQEMKGVTKDVAIVVVLAFHDHVGRL